MNNNYYTNKAVVVEGINIEGLTHLVREVVKEVIKPIKKDVAELIGTNTYTTKQAAQRLGVHYTTVHRKCKSGEIVATKRGRNNIITHENLQKYMEG